MVRHLDRYTPDLEIGLFILDRAHFDNLPQSLEARCRNYLARDIPEVFRGFCEDWTAT
jgi:hypothetical protein